MRVFASSDLHVDYEHNAKWVDALSKSDYRDDVMIVAGDVSDRLSALGRCLRALADRFQTVLFVPGNHELWVVRDGPDKDSFDKFVEVSAVAADSGASMRPYRAGGLCIVPLLGWYDYTFGTPCDALRAVWMDYFACRWPAGVGAREVSLHFAALNATSVPDDVERVVTFSHFMPRIDLMPSCVPAQHRMLYPVLGSTHLDGQLRKLGSHLHVYGHSHVNRRKVIDGVTYVNNAFGYPHEDRIASKRLLHVPVDGCARRSPPATSICGSPTTTGSIPARWTAGFRY